MVLHSVTLGSDSKTIYYVAASLDGLIAGPGGDLSWLETYTGTDEDYGFREFIDSIETLVMGSKTYEQLVEFGPWPYGEKPTYIATKRDLPPAEGAELRFRDGRSSALLQEIKCESHGDIWLVGGGALAGDMLENNLIDEVRLFVIPVLLGEGVPLFSGIKETTQLIPAGMTRYESGVTGLNYRAPT